MLTDDAKVYSKWLAIQLDSTWNDTKILVPATVPLGAADVCVCEFLCFVYRIKLKLVHFLFSFVYMEIQ